ncbi:MAG: MG2 domain-containing protein [Weeksellaceae bacterium]
MKKSILLFTFLALIILGCKSKKDVNNYHLMDVNPEYAAYVSAYTSGLISTESPIKILIQADIPLEINDDKSLKKQVLHFKPSLKGTTYLVDNTTLEFRPDEKLKQGEIYTATLELESIVPTIPKELQDFQFQFQAKKQDYSVSLEGIQNTDAGQGNYKFVGNVFTADVADASEINKMLSAKFNGKELPVSWEHSQNRRNHRFTIDGIASKDKAENLVLKWKGSAIATKKDEKNEFAIPAVNDFKVTQIKAISTPEQYISINFSEPIQNDQFVDGLIELEKTNKSQETDDNYYSDEKENYIKSTIINGNELKVYTSKKIGGEYALNIFPGISSSYGNKIETKQTETLNFVNLYPQVKFVGNGSIIPSSDGKVNLPFQAVGLKAVRVEITQIFENNIHQFFQYNHFDETNNLRPVGQKVLSKVIPISNSDNFNSNELNVYQLELSKFIEPQPGAIYNVEFSFEHRFAVYPCSGVQNQEEFLARVEPERDNYDADSEMYTYDYYDYYYPEDYNWNDRNNPCTVSYYTSDKKVSKSILASNLGITFKTGKNRIAYASVSDIVSSDPMENVKIKAYDLQNQLVGEGSTDGNGFAEFNLKRQPFLVIAEKNKQKNYIRVDNGSSLSLSNFDVEGESSANSLGGFIYGERGVWRPGDKIHLTFVSDPSVLNVSDQQPAILELNGPDGQLMQRKVNTAPVNGFYTFELETAPDAKTGNWSAEVKLGGRTFYKTVKIETIKPNRLKINTIFPNDVLTKSTTSSGFKIKANWLSGAEAQSLKATVTGHLFSEDTKFKSFPNYIFSDPSRSFPMQELTLFEGNLNANGEATISTNMNLDYDAPGMLKLGVFTKVFEAGGDFSTSYVTKDFSPYTSYVGLKIPSKNDYFEMLETGKEHRIEVASVDFKGNPISKDRLEVSIYRMKNSWWYNSDDNDLAYYVNRNYEFLQEEKTAMTTNGKGSFTLQVPNEEYGNYFIRIYDPVSGHATGKTIWFDWPDWRSRSDGNSESAAILNFKADKTAYKVGETAQITLPSSVAGRALVSFENGTKVIERKWIKTAEGNTKFDVKITPEMAPNFYVNISLLQPHNATTNDRPIRMYGVIPIRVENPDRKLEPQISAPESIRPNSSYTVSVSEKSGGPMTYTLAVVDEGLLGITNFQTPDIFKHFNQKQALGVNTWDIFNYVLGAYGGRIESVFTIGGDQALANSNKEKINRFKPVVTFLGPFTLAKGEKKSHNLKMENYIGAVKVMVVAGQKSAFGSAEKNIFVKQPLMTLTSLPRVLNPGDEITLPVNVFAMDAKIKNAQVSIKSNDLIQIDGSSSQNLTFSKIGDQMATFKLKIPEKLGKATLTIRAVSGNEKTSEEIEIEVRSPNPPMTFTDSKEISGSGNWDGTYQPFGMKGTTDTKLVLSSVPAMNLDARLRYLIQYPHGCVEQITSSAFPQLYLEKLTQLTDAQKKSTQYNVEETLKKLKSYQTPSGGLAYWPGLGDADKWGSTYALHFILKAEETGYKLPAGLKEGLIKYQKKIAKDWNGYNEKYYYNDLDQAYRLYTLALSGNSELGLMNRLKEKKTNVTTVWRLAAAYQLAGQGSIAKKLVADLPNTVKEYKFNAYTYGSSVRDDAMILETLTLLGERDKGLVLLKKIAAHLHSDSWYSTQTTSYSLLAISEYLGKNKAGSNIDATVRINGKSSKISGNKPFVNVDLPEASGSFSVVNHSGGILFVDLVRSGVSMEENIPEIQKNLGLKVTYFNMDNEAIDPSQLSQGTDFKCVVNITNPGMMGNYKELTLTQMFPSGWEIINKRLNNQATSAQNTGLNYQDFRDDRVYSYFDLSAAQQISVTILLNATYKGDYYLPATYCEAMYDNSIQAVVPGKRIRVN